MGRPDADMGGVGRLSPPSPAAGRCVGRMVVGPSGEAVRTGAGFGGAVRVRMTRGAASGVGAGVSETTGVDVLTSPRVSVTAGALSGALSVVATASPLTALGALAPLPGSSGWTSRRSPSASALRRTRSA